MSAIAALLVCKLGT